MKITQYCKQTLLITLGCIAFVLGLPACQQEGSAEKAGQKIDRAVDNVGQKIEQTTEQAGQKAEAAKESVEQQAEKTGAYINESAEASKSALEKAGQKIDHAAEQAGQNIEQATEKAGNAIEGAKESVVDKAVTTGEYIDDAAITLNVKTAILNDPVLKASEIEVTTVNGVVTLSGTVDSEQLVTKVIGLVNSQKNVKSVQNNLMIKTTAPSKQ